MSKRLSGHVILSGNHYKTRVRFPDGTRPWFHLRPGLTESQAKSEAVELQRLATSGQLVREDEQAPKGETVAEWFERWLAHREAKGLTSTSDDRARFAKHIKPVLGPVVMAKVTRREVERLRNRLDDAIRERDTNTQAGMSAKSAANIWTLITSAFKEAQNSKRLELRCREDNPCLNVQPPDNRERRSRTYLYPEELNQLLLCDEVPLSRRRCYALACYLGARKGELATLTAADVDFARGLVHIHQAADRREKGTTKRTKGGKARRIPLEPAIVPLLQRMIEEVESGSRFVPVYERRQMGDKLRFDLKTAGIDRGDLFANDQTRAQIDFHDLRGTTATWMALRGDPALQIKQRLGHNDLKTTERYIREAEIYRERFGAPFPVVPACLLGLDQRLDQAGAKSAKISAKRSGGAGNRKPSLEGVDSAIFAGKPFLSDVSEQGYASCSQPKSTQVDWIRPQLWRHCGGTQPATRGRTHPCSTRKKNIFLLTINTRCDLAPSCPQCR